MLKSVFDGSIEQENQFPKSSRLLILKALSAKGYQVGYLNSQFIINRKFISNEEKFEEQDRLVRLGDLQILGGKKYKRKGIATRMIKAIEEYANQFGASKIEGILSAIDTDSEPWLPDMYRKLGYEVKEEANQRKIVKELK